MQRLFFTAFVAVLFASCSRTETARPQRKDITEVIFANGELYKSAEYVATANADGFLQWLAVQEGDSVAVGSTIARIGSDIARINLDMARTNYGDTVAKTTDQAPEIQQLAAQIEQARAQAKNDEANCRRLEPLAATHTVSVLDFENAKLKHEASLAQLKVLEKNMAEVRNALALAAKNAGGQLKIQQENLREFRVTAQISGQVLARKQGLKARKIAGKSGQNCGAQVPLFPAKNPPENPRCRAQLSCWYFARKRTGEAQKKAVQMCSTWAAAFSGKIPQASRKIPVPSGTALPELAMQTEP